MPASIGDGENHNAWQHDAARLIAVKQEAEAGRCGGHGESGDAESRGSGFAMPAEACGERLEKEAERVWHNRAAKLTMTPKKPARTIFQPG
jgi:hypothetical protein